MYKETIKAKNDNSRNEHLLRDSARGCVTHVGWRHFLQIQLPHSIFALITLPNMASQLSPLSKSYHPESAHENH